MQVGGSTSSLPLSTQIIKKAGQAAQAPETPGSPEQVNRAVDRGSDRVTQSQASREQTQTDRRTYATQIYSANSQQKQIDTYLAVASEGKVDSTSGSTSAALQLRDNANSKSLPDISNNPGPQRPPAESVKPTPYLDTRA